MVEGIDETTMLVQWKTGQSYVFTSKNRGSQLLNPSEMLTFPKISCSEALSAADAQPQATSTKLLCALL